MLHFFLQKGKGLEYCFNVEASDELDAGELSILRHLLADGFIAQTISTEPAGAGGTRVGRARPEDEFRYGLFDEYRRHMSDHRP